MLNDPQSGNRGEQWKFLYIFLQMRFRALTESEQNSVISQSSLMELRGELSTWRSKAVHDL